MAVQADNLTKVIAGGSGDNIVADGYIKTVEKVWIDSYTFAQTGTNTTIQIAKLDENKKITGISIEIYATASHTSGTISIGYSVDNTNDLAPTGVANFLAPYTITHNLTRTSIAIPGVGLLNSANYTGVGLTIAHAVMAGLQGVTSGTQTTIAVKLNNWTMTTGTLKSIVRYT